jgi:hypothetical protein
LALIVTHAIMLITKRMIFFIIYIRFDFCEQNNAQSYGFFLIYAIFFVILPHN